MKKFKSFLPKVDIKRRLVLTRFYTGVKESNSFCYIVQRINKKGELDKRYKSLYAYGTDDFKSVSQFSHSLSGKPVKVFKTSFKSAFGLKAAKAVDIWNSYQKQVSKV